MTTKVKEYESQAASREVHEGGRYVIQNGKPVKEKTTTQAEKKEAK